MEKKAVNGHLTVTHFAATIQRLLLINTLLVLLFNGASAQTQSSSATDGTTTPPMAPGAPAGSYMLSGFENVNLYNGGLNFSLPLLSVSGRGNVRMSPVLTVEQKWRVGLYRYMTPGGWQEIRVPEPNWWTGDESFRYGPGLLVGRMAGENPFSCNQGANSVYLKTLTRLTFKGPDGTEHELRDQLTGGQPSTNTCNSMSVPTRGTVFTSADGTGITFVADGPIADQLPVANGPIYLYFSGYLLFKDGTRFRINGGNVTELRDRNGNKMSFTYDVAHRVSTITDSINRQVTVLYDQAEGGQYGTCDRITFKGFGGVPRYIRVCKSSLGSSLRTTQPSDVTTPQTFAALFPGLNGSTGTAFNPTVVNSVWLPDGRRYQLFYNQYGELARVVLPTGGAYEYDWRAGVVGTAASGVTGQQIYRRVVERRIYSVGTTAENRTVYSRPESYDGMTWANSGFVVVKQCKPTGADAVGECGAGSVILSHTKHYFSGWPSQSIYIPPTGYPAWTEGREYKTEAFDINGTTILRRVENTFAQRAPVSWWTGSSATAPPNDVRSTELLTTLVDTNQVSRQTFGYDDSVPFNNQNNVKEYDFGMGAAGGLVRETRTTYITSAGYTGTSVHLRSLASQVSVVDAGGIERARTTFEYDNYTPDPNHAALSTCPNISGFDPAFNTSYLTRGNVTCSTRHKLVNGSVTGSISACQQYDIAGNSVKIIDARGFITTLEFADRFGFPDAEAQSNTPGFELGGLTSYAFATKVTNAANHISYTQFDYYRGPPVNSEDANGVVTSASFNDALDRPTQIRRAVGTALTNQTTFAYDDVGRVITTNSDLNSNNDNALVSKAFYDGLGRTTETRQYEGGTNYIATQQQYDALSRPFKRSNPYRPWQNEIAIWTTTTFDALGRVLTMTTPDNAVVTSSYSGNTATVTDQDATGKKRKSVTDALGRLKEVYEDPLGLNYLTSYSYDVLDNLTVVTQGTQARTFVYDSLKRLTSATNPENGTITYLYDSNGNLTQKTDARSIVTAYAYDALNRNTTVNYSDTTVDPDTTRTYDTATNGKGRLRESYAGGTETVGTNVEHTKIISYDALGRPLDQRQRFKSNSVWSADYQIQRAYNRAGGVTSQTYPSFRTVNYAYDTAGRLSSFSGNLGDGGPNRTYSTGIIYSSLGGMAKEQLGTDIPLYNKSFYNSRGQLSEIRVGTTYNNSNDGGWERGAIINHYSSQCWGACNGTDNNGNLKQQDHWIPDVNGGVQAVIVQAYTYDSLNRLQRVQEGSWQQEFVYDRWGNRTIHQTNTWGTGINKKDFTVNTANNRLGVPAGQPGVMTYDNAGNLITDTYTGAGSRVYDAENRMTRAWGGNNQWQDYTYNADGQRTRRKIDGVETWQIYGMDGELAAEYPASGATGSPQKEYGYRNGQLLITAEPRTNFALAGNGAVASASSSYTPGSYQPGGAINGDRKGLNWGNNGGWNDAAPGNTFPDWLQVDFNGSKTIDEINVFTEQDQPFSPLEPTETMTFSLYGLTGFDVQYWNGSTWVTVTGGSVTGNNKVWRKVTFQPITTTKIRVLTNASVDGYSRIMEVEAWGAWTGSGSLSASINWLVADQLGTPRMTFDKTGSLATTKRHDYLPFGEELFAGVGGRTTILGYTGDTIRQKFTSKERDIETGLDYFLARYYSATQGRFSSIDPLMASASTIDPQSFNRYSYVRNKPLVTIDPNGMDDCEIGRTCSFTTNDWATNGVHPEQGQIRETVTINTTDETPLSTSSLDPGAVSLNLASPVLADQYVPTPDTLPHGGGHDKPDRENFTQISVGGDFLGVGFDLSATYDEFGNWYVGGGPSLGLSWPVSASVVSGTTYDDLGIPIYTEREVATILQGPSTAVTFGAGFVGNASWNNPTILGILPIPLLPSGGSTQAIGVGTPQIGIGQTWAFKIPGLKWNPRKSQ